MTFEELQLTPSLCRALRAKGYATPTPIQVQAIPHALAGRDVIGCAQTGTGKTAAFALPILQRLKAPVPGTSVRCLVLAPTRELATQIAESFRIYGSGSRFKQAVVFGGSAEGPQVEALRQGVDILVATPGRLRALMLQRKVSFRGLEILVLDEADRMLDMGFIRDVQQIIAALPRQRQTLFFSATMPPDIQALASSLLVNPARVEVTPVATPAESVDQTVFHVSRIHKRDLLLHVLQDAAMSRALVFTRTKSGANRLAQHLAEAGHTVDAIHGNKSQNARERALDGFKRGRIRVLVATDIAARGIDVDGVTHVVNFDIPNVPESYVHRIGRTGRGSATGSALSFCDPDERSHFRDIERTTRRPVKVNEDHPFRSAARKDSPRTDATPPPPSRSARPRPGPSKPGAHARRPDLASVVKSLGVPPPPVRAPSKWA
jgi:ATP-dependent RNA helicase RhlE